MRESAPELAPAKAGRQVSWAGENREVLSLAFGLTVPVQRKLPVSVLTVLPKGRLCVTCEMSHLRRCDDEGLPSEHVSFQAGGSGGVVAGVATVHGSLPARCGPLLGARLAPLQLALV